MSRVDLLNAVAVAVALAGSVAAAHAPSTGPASASPPPSSSTSAAEGFRRIASATTIGDRLLLEVCEPDRIVAFTAVSAAGPDGHRYAGKATVRSLDRIEALVQLAPDALVVSNVGDPRRVARLEEAGLEVVDLGVPTGWASLRPAVETVAALCGDPGRGEAAWRRLDVRAQALAAGVAPQERPEAMVLTTYGGRLYGGTVGSNYHDVLRLAGVVDVAAVAHRGVPQLTVEQVLALAPAWIVTKAGQGEALCGRPELASLGACRQGRVVEVEGTALDDPGLGILDAASEVHAAIFGAR